MNDLSNFLSGETKPTVRGEISIDTQSILIASGVIVVSAIAVILFYRLITMPDRAK